MIDYYLNFMGPISDYWHKKYNIPQDVYLYCGRIDIGGIPKEPFGREISVPIMYGESWCLFGDWLNEYESEKILTLEKLVNIFEKESNHKIKWLEEER